MRKFRVLPTELIPPELWSDDVLRLPNDAVACYSAELTALGLIDDARQGTDKKNIHGGCEAAETLEHFTYRFSVSAGRLEFITIAPDSALSAVSDSLISDLSEGNVALLDIPCGCGSSAITLLGTIGALREKGSLGTLPLSVTIVGGDCSEKALETYDSMMRRLQPTLEGYGIAISWETVLWDATRADSTALLVDRWFALSHGAGEYIVCVANFSGALATAEAFEEFSPSLEQILGRLHDKRGALLWVEPSGRQVQKKIIPRILGLLSKRMPWFSPASGSSAFTSAKYQAEDPLNKNIFPSGVEIQRFVRK